MKKKVQSDETKKKAAEKNKLLAERKKKEGEIEKCKGILKNRKRCKQYPDKGEIYCDVHEYFKELSDEQIVEIKKTENSKAKGCRYCPKWHFGEGKLCSICLEKKAINNKKVQDMKKKRVKCGWKKTEIELCDNYTADDSDYCTTHDYVNNYTEEMKEKSEFHSTCRKVRYIENGCDYCIEIRKKRKLKNNAPVRNDPKCPVIINGHQCPNFVKENGYCGQHKHQVELDKIDENKKACSNHIRGCKNLLDKNSEFSRCEPCRIEARKKDKKRRQKNKNKIKISDLLDDISTDEEALEALKKTFLSQEKETVNNSESEYEIISATESSENKTKPQINIDIDKLLDNSNNESNIKKKGKVTIIDDTKKENDKIIQVHSNDEMQKIIDDKTKTAKKYCEHCKTYKPIELFITSKGKVGRYCDVGRELERERERKRDRSSRRDGDYANYDRRPEVKERKKQWREDNYEKTAGYWIDYRARRIEDEGVDVYLKKNAEYAKDYRKRNPEKQQEKNDKKRVDLASRLYYYKHRAKNCGIEYNLTDEESIKLFLGDCYYCGSPALDGYILNGIDRKINELEYDSDNCVSCCDMCNRMKKDMDDKTFIKVCEHILTNLGIIDGNLHPECFTNYISGDFNKYNYRASTSDIEFRLTETQFYKIIDCNCYLCGKENSFIHNNGIDRINNYLGYFLQNCKACCGTCNYLKNAYELSMLLLKLVKICKIHKIINVNINVKILKDKCLNMYTQLLTDDIDNIINNEKKLMLKKQRNYRDRRRKEMGDDNYKEMLRVQKAKQSGKFKSNQKIPPKRVKKTKEEIKEAARLRKQKQRRLLREKYGDVEYKKKHANEIARNRSNKKK